MAPPTAEEQVEFLQKLQRLLREGSFTSTYKYALLLAICDLAVEHGDDAGSPLRLETRQIGEKFVQYYWRQAAPYAARGRSEGGRPLLQNTDRQAAVVSELVEARRAGTTLTALRRDARAWQRLVGRVTAVVEKMPLWKLQTVGTAPLEFLYPNRSAGTHAIELRPVAVFCLRRFHGLIHELVRGSWLRFVRGLRANQDSLGQANDLAAFLFGSGRADLAACKRVLWEHDDRCFYCDARLSDGAVVDHFVPWSLYPVDLGHNFVLADPHCNAQKTNLLAAEAHLARWCDRNERLGAGFEARLGEAGIVADASASRQITRWAYAQADAAKALVWSGGTNRVPLGQGWQELGWLRVEAQEVLLAAEAPSAWES